MKNLFVLGLVLFLGACGQSPLSTQNVNPSPTACAAGSVFSTMYGMCLQQTANCSGNYAIYNNGCVYAIPSATVTPTTGSTASSCTAGSVYSSTYGQCLQQDANCFGTYALYNNYCVYVGTTTSPTAGTTNPYQGSCASGKIQTDYGCFPQGSCSVGYGEYTGFCFPSIYL